MKITILPYETKRDIKLKYVIIATRFQQSKWVFVQHRERKTWELPAGHIENGEQPDDAAKRELFEETGATCYTISPLFDYSAKNKAGIKNFGRVYLADVDKLGDLPESEIAKVKLRKKLPNKLTYPKIQPILFEQVINWINDELDN